VKIGGCRFEKAVWTAVASGAWSQELRQHAAACAVCGEVAQVSGGLLELSREGPAANRLPDPRQILWRAEWLAAQSAGERATRPILLYLWFATAMGVLGLAGFVFWAWPLVESWLPGWRVELPTFGLSFPTPAVYGAVLPICAVIALAFRWVLSAD
jgi:hypothetical protein